MPRDILTLGGWRETDAGWMHPDTDEEVYTELEALRLEGEMDSVLGLMAKMKLSILAMGV